MITDYKAPTDIKVELRGWSVNVSWQAPIYEQTAYWGNWEDSGYVLGYDKSNAPFYFGQAWTPEDLEPVNKKTITAIRFFAQRGVTYSIYIKQGERIHRQPLSNISTGEFHTVPLTTSFAIDASETLIVSLYATGYGNTNFPAALDKGPAVNNKGNVISLDGEEWSISGQDYNFMVSMTISSEEKTITQTAKERTSLSIHSEYTESMIAIQKRETISSIQTLSQPVVSFPEITNYNIYRNGVLASVINSTTTEFTDYGPGAGDYTYSVSALYGNIQSSKVESEQSITVDNENISPDILRLTPTLFHEQVTVISADPVTLVEVYSIDGRKHIHLTYPDTSIPTGGLPAGLYIFRIHTDKEIKTIKGVKQR